MRMEGCRRDDERPPGDGERTQHTSARGKDAGRIVDCAAIWLGAQHREVVTTPHSGSFGPDALRPDQAVKTVSIDQPYAHRGKSELWTPLRPLG